MHYPTHSLGLIVGVTGERVTEVSCLGWGGKHPWFDSNQYGNRFWNEASLMRTNQGHMVRCNVFWLVGAGGERAQWFGEKGSLYMENSGLSPETWHERTGHASPIDIPEFWKTSPMLPKKMRHASGHGGSAVFLCAEFINALVEDREPTVDVYESLAMTVPGIVAHESAKRNGEQLAVPQFERAG